MAATINGNIREIKPPQLKPTTPRHTTQKLLQFRVVNCPIRTYIGQKITSQSFSEIKSENSIG